MSFACNFENYAVLGGNLVASLDDVFADTRSVSDRLCLKVGLSGNCPAVGKNKSELKMLLRTEFVVNGNLYADFSVGSNVGCAVVVNPEISKYSGHREGIVAVGGQHIRKALSAVFVCVCLVNFSFPVSYCYTLADKHCRMKRHNSVGEGSTAERNTIRRASVYRNGYNAVADISLPVLGNYFCSVYNTEN